MSVMTIAMTVKSVRKRHLTLDDVRSIMGSMASRSPLTSEDAGERLEAATGIEPVYRALQALAYRHETTGQRLCSIVKREDVTT